MRSRTACAASRRALRFDQRAGHITITIIVSASPPSRPITSKLMTGVGSDAASGSATTVARPARCLAAGSRRGSLDMLSGLLWLLTHEVLAASCGAGSARTLLAGGAAERGRGRGGREPEGAA